MTATSLFELQLAGAHEYEADGVRVIEGFTAGVLRGTEAHVAKDIADRQALGINKYGTTVAENPLELRAWLQHAYEEALDQAIYLKRAIEEIDRCGCRNDQPR